MNKIVIYSCVNNHHWIEESICPFCGESSIKSFDFQEGDCIKCGNLCPGYAYGCNSPEPLNLEK